MFRKQCRIQVRETRRRVGGVLSGGMFCRKLGWGVRREVLGQRLWRRGRMLVCGIHEPRVRLRRGRRGCSVGGDMWRLSGLWLPRLRELSGGGCCGGGWSVFCGRRSSWSGKLKEIRILFMVAGGSQSRQSTSSMHTIAQRLVT